MNAKDAIFAELGDLFKDYSGNVVQDATEKETELIVEEEESDDSDIPDALADIEGDRPPSLFDMPFTEEGFNEIADGESIEEKLKSLTDEECKACVKAINTAISTTKMSPSQVEWGLDIMDRICDIQNERILEGLNAIDWDAEKQRIAQEEAEEEERENADKEAYLRR